MIFFRKFFSYIVVLSCFQIFIQFLIVNSAQARPEYATRHAVNRCTACHFSPSGGGLRNQYGKLYGARGFQISKYAQQDYLSADIRFAYYNPSQRETTRSGLFLMAGLVGGSVPVSSEDGATEVRLVLSHDVLTPAHWDTYVRIRKYEDVETSWAPQYYVFGRFHAPFGLLQDEHRTYTRLQTLSEYNKKLEAGFMLSGQPLESLHYDLALVNGEATSANLGTGNAEMWGGVGNLRFMSHSRWWPFMLGASYKFYERPSGLENPWAASAYGVFSLERLTGGTVQAEVLFEYAVAKNMNDQMQVGAGFPSQNVYRANVSDKESEGLYTQVNYYLTERFVLQAKYDRLELNKKYSGDAYQRTGLGLKHYLPANTILMLRIERAIVGQPDEKVSPHHRSDDAVWAVVQFGI